MWSDNDGPYEGKHYQLESTLNVPQSIKRPRPPIMVAGGGEKKTLRMVAQYADACNIGVQPGFDDEAPKHKLDVLRQHCADLGRDYDEISKTALYRLDLGENGENVPALLEDLHRLHELGFDGVHSGVKNAGSLTPIETIGKEIIPVMSQW